MAKKDMCMRVRAILTGLFLVSMDAGAVSFRRDLFMSFDKLLCGDTEKKVAGLEAAPPASRLWRHGIFDAGARVYLLGPKGASQQLEKAAQSMARKNYHKGYSFGKCAKNRYWIVTTPSPIAFKQEGEIMRLKAQDLHSYCKWFRIDYAHAQYGRPRKLFKSKDQKVEKSLLINTTLLERGSLSITCKPKKPTWLGPVLWSLAPVKKGPLEKAFLAGSVEQKAPKALENWINLVRVNTDLGPLSSTEAFSHITKPLISKNLSIRHHRKDIRKVSREIKKQKGRFLGENRVKADSFEEAAWLLWNSPRHRSLLLHSKATHLATMAKRVKSERLSVMVFAKF